MACPYFEPQSPLDWQSWRATLRPPLGSPYAGVCHAGEPFRPDLATLTDNCNMGYAAGCCPHFKPGAGDAVRFAIARGEERPESILWLVEADCLPVFAGELSVAAIEAGAEPSEAPAHLGAQLRAYAASYQAFLAEDGAICSDTVPNRSKA